MRSGKPPAPWRRDRRRRGPRVVAIAALVVLFSAAGTYALWRMRPAPLPWHAFGGERIATPAFDISDSAVREASGFLSGGTLNAYRGQWLGRQCSSEAPSNVEIYVLTRDGVGVGSGPPVASRTVFELSGGGVVTHEQFAAGSVLPFARTSRAFDEREAERFRDQLLDGGFLRMAPAETVWRCHREIVTFESCLRGRYYGVVRGACQDPDVEPSLHALADDLEAFAREAEPALP